MVLVVTCAESRFQTEGSRDGQAQGGRKQTRDGAADGVREGLGPAEMGPCRL